MHEADVAPDPQLMESMRAVGYTLETAIADIVDNSITAQARHVDVHFAAHPLPYIAVIDDGVGMDEVALTEAMRLAGKSPVGTRAVDDLGRFGLGLKTASLSQCRTLTVLSKQQGEIRGVRWSLDHLAKTGRWALLMLEDAEVQQVPGVSSLTGSENGTLVVWTDLDQVHALPDQLERQLDEEMMRVRDHLALVFHRFVGDARRPLQLRMNSVDIPAIDPFLQDHRATQASAPEMLTADGEPIRLQAFTLPYLSKLTAAERARAQIAGTMRDSQGFYIYRAKRLVIWGTWFRIVPKDDLGKLARVRVDIPNSLDHLWSLDIKKSTAVPPPEVRAALRRLAGRFVHPSKTTHMYRGRPARPDDPLDRMWTLVEDRGTFRYEVNRSHPGVAVLADSLDKRELLSLEQLLRVLEASFPVEDAYNRLGSDTEHKPAAVDQQELIELARMIWGRREASGASIDDVAAQLSTVEPFSGLPDVGKFLRKVLI
jgi:hypothetical protein